jgi:hypothetical protein
MLGGIEREPDKGVEWGGGGRKLSDLTEALETEGRQEQES